MACIPVWAAIAASRIIFPSGWALGPLPNTWLEIGRMDGSASRSVAISIATTHSWAHSAASASATLAAWHHCAARHVTGGKVFMKPPKTFE